MEEVAHSAGEVVLRDAVIKRVVKPKGVHTGTAEWNSWFEKAVNDFRGALINSHRLTKHRQLRLEAMFEDQVINIIMMKLKTLKELKTNPKLEEYENVLSEGDHTPFCDLLLVALGIKQKDSVFRVNVSAAAAVQAYCADRSPPYNANEAAGMREELSALLRQENIAHECGNAESIAESVGEVYPFQVCIAGSSADNLAKQNLHSTIRDIALEEKSYSNRGRGNGLFWKAYLAKATVMSKDLTLLEVAKKMDAVCAKAVDDQHQQLDLASGMSERPERRSGNSGDESSDEPSRSKKTKHKSRDESNRHDPRSRPDNYSNRTRNDRRKREDDGRTWSPDHSRRRESPPRRPPPAKRAVITQPRTAEEKKGTCPLCGRHHSLA